MKLLSDPNNSHDYSHSVAIDSYYIPRCVHLTPTALRAIACVNAGGKSEISEALSINYFEKIFGAHSIILEMEVEYWIDYSMVDYVCTVGQHRIGVSVTRAMGYPEESIFTAETAKYLLRRKIMLNSW